MFISTARRDAFGPCPPDAVPDIAATIAHAFLRHHGARRMRDVAAATIAAEAGLSPVSGSPYLSLRGATATRQSGATTERDCRVAVAPRNDNASRSIRSPCKVGSIRLAMTGWLSVIATTGSLSLLAMTVWDGSHSPAIGRTGALARTWLATSRPGDRPSVRPDLRRGSRRACGLGRGASPDPVAGDIDPDRVLGGGPPLCRLAWAVKTSSSTHPTRAAASPPAPARPPARAPPRPPETTPPRSPPAFQPGNVPACLRLRERLRPSRCCRHHPGRPRRPV